MCSLFIFRKVRARFSVNVARTITSLLEDCAKIYIIGVALFIKLLNAHCTAKLQCLFSIVLLLSSNLLRLVLLLIVVLHS